MRSHVMVEVASTRLALPPERPLQIAVHEFASRQRQRMRHAPSARLANMVPVGFRDVILAS